jgi:GntR family transcriptional regulator
VGALRPDEPLPSIRDLAGDLVVNPNTVARAYRELEQDGFIYTQKGRGCYVSSGNASAAAKVKQAVLNRVFDGAIEEAFRFGLEPAEIRRLVDLRLARAEKHDGK